MKRDFVLNDFDYHLPQELIAQEPAVPRDSCKMLVFDSSCEAVEHRKFSDIEDFFVAGDVVVFNTSKVIPARVIFNVAGKELEIFLLKSCGDGVFECLVRPGKVFKLGYSSSIRDGFSFEVIDVLENGHRLVRFTSPEDGAVSDSVLYKKLGVLPLPPYIKNFGGDMSYYQTVYADAEGSLAAPTAGLHFTNDLIARLKAKGVIFENVLLHVGLGTFLPVKTERVSDHEMHEESFVLAESTAEALNLAKLEGRRIVAVGTTTVRVLESVLKEYGTFVPTVGETKIFIYPGAHEWRGVDALITNFHLPKSTLLMLVSSFLNHKIGSGDPLEQVKKVYLEAVEEKYKFFSFGDAMFIY